MHKQKDMVAWMLLVILATFLNLVFGLLPAKAGSGSPSTESLNYEEFFSCGPNALYMFMIVSGHPTVSLEAVKAEIPITSRQGSSLLALRNAARKFGIETEMLCYSRQRADSVPLPAIVHISHLDLGTFAPYHFDVMYKMDADWVYLLNGTTAESTRVRRSKFPAWWTGYALIQKRSFFPRMLDQWWPGMAICLFIANLVVFAIWFRKTEWHTASQSITEPKASA